MKLLFESLLLILLLVTAQTVLATSDKEPPCEPDPFMQLPRPEIYAGHFMSAVERESLIVLGYRVDSAILRPIRVEYHYSLDGDPPMVEIYAILKLPMDLDDFPGCSISAVTAVMTLDGTIVEVQAHIETF